MADATNPLAVETVNVFNPQGELVSIPHTQLSDAYESGYTPVTQETGSQYALQEKYGTPEEQTINVAKHAAKNLLPFGAGQAAFTALGENPKVAKYETEANPVGSTVGDVGGFLGSLAVPVVGQAGVVGKIGQGAAELAGLANLDSSASIAQKVAAGAVKGGAELAAMSSGDAVARSITNPDEGVGSAISNVGLSTAIGSILGGGFSFAGGAGAKALEKLGLNSEGLSSFRDRLISRSSGVDPTENLQNEMKNLFNYYGDEGYAISGKDGLKSQALDKILPAEVNPEMGHAITDIAYKGHEALLEMAEKKVPEKWTSIYQSEYAELLNTLNNPSASVGDKWDALNKFKGDLYDYAKGRWGKGAVSKLDEDYNLIKITKALGTQVKDALENPEIWGKDAASLQKGINEAWSKTLPVFQQVRTDLMGKVGRDFIPDVAKFRTYVNQAGKFAGETIKQQRIGAFLEGMDKFTKAVSNIYEKAGVEAPELPGMSALRDSLNKQSIPEKLADAWYNKLASKSLGTAVGAGVGGALGSAIPIPGAGAAGLFVGSKLGSSVLPTFIQPLLEKATNSAAFNHATEFGINAAKGNGLMRRSASAVFQGSKSIIPKAVDAATLDDRLKKIQQNPQKMLNMSTSSLGHYMPGHATALAETTMNAVNYLNARRPIDYQNGPLGNKVPPSKAQKAKFDRLLKIADQPLSIMAHIKDGTLLPSDIEAFKSMYPLQFYNKISQEISSAMIQHISKGGKIPYSLKQSLSLFLGEPLDGTLTPPSMQAAQMVFAQQTAQKQQAAGGGKPPAASKTNHLAKAADQYRTGSQAAASRQSKA